MNRQLPPLDKIKAFFPKHRICVVKTLLLLLDCVLQSRTVNLNKCKCRAFAAAGLQGGNLSSVYTRFIRFFKIKHSDSFCLGVMLLILNMLLPCGTAHLVIDRTNWEIGKTKINVLCIGFLLPNGVFIPVMWETLPKKGNSSEKERIALLKRFQEAWPSGKAYQFIVLGDREFIGLDWCEWMVKNSLSFVVRLRWQDYFGLVAQASNSLVLDIERKIPEQVAKNGFFQCAITYEKQVFYFTVLPNTAKRRQGAKPNAGDDFVVLLSPIQDVQTVSEYYRKRWSIETFFGHIKKNGFNLEDMNLKNQQKVQMMMGVVAIAYSLSIREGLRVEEMKTFNFKKHGARPVSIFRKGYDQLQTRIYQLKDLVLLIIEFIAKPYVLVLKT